jgi:hypothetical protein
MIKSSLISMSRFLMSLPILFGSQNFLHAEDAHTRLKTQQKNTAPDLSSKLLNLRNAPYDDETYQLAYKTFMFNSHVKDAYELALIAVTKQHGNITWHERLAQTAIWVGDYNTGMKEWLYIAHHTKDLNTIKKAAFTARLLGYDQVTAALLKLYLIAKPYAIDESIAFAYAENRINKPEHALITLKKLNQLHPTRAAYELMARIYQDTDQWDQALNTWDIVNKEFGISVQSASIQAEIYYTRKHYKKALSILRQAIPVANETNTDFWRTIADLAWMINDQSLAALGYSHFPHDKSALFKLIELEQSTHLQKALDYALQGWRQYQDMQFFNTTLYFAVQQKEWSTVDSLIKSLTVTQTEEAQQTLLYWEAQANRYAALGEKDAQKKILIQGLSLYPEMIQLRASLLFLLIDDGEFEWVKALMEDGYEHHLWQDALIWTIYADVFALLNKSYAVLLMYQHHLPQGVEESQLLIDYGHALEKVKLDQQAYNLWSELWIQILSRLKKEHSLQKNTYRILAQLAPHFVSGTDQAHLLNTLFDHGLGDKDLLVLLNWMVPQNYFELISYFKAFYLNNKLPVWAGTNLALAHNDLPTLQKMLEQREHIITRSDLINAAVRLENTPLAMDLAFSELTERPAAHELYEEFTQFGITNANDVQLNEEYEQFVNVAGQRNKLAGTFRLTNTWSMKPGLSYWRIHSTSPSTITNLPYADSLAQVKLSQKIHRGSLNYNLGYRKDLNNFVPAAIDGTYQLNALWTGLFKLGYNQENFQNPYMREGGVQDQINLGISSHLGKYDSLKLELQGLNYYSQDRHYLADGYNIESLLEHKFWLSYPDFTLGLFGNFYQFRRNGSYGGDVTTLFPQLPAADQNDPALVALANEQNYKQLISQNYQEGGLIFSFGNTILEYSHAWRPYLWTRLYYNTITSLSNEIHLGMNGSLWGSDSLLIYGERGTAQASQGQTNYMFGAKYMLYY